ncbi:MAG: SAM-dependent methyltransferase [Myxococcales bacterium]|nr:SAM-dependent methyltransferase [Myxococcales bacterium]
MEARIPYESCPLCEGRELDEHVVADCTGYPFYSPELGSTQRWLRCRACTHVFVDGYFTEQALRLLFARTHAGQEPGHDIEAARYVSAKMVESVNVLHPRLGGRWLDVGFGNGALLTTADEFGWDVVGLDLREDNVRTIRELGFEAHAIELTAYRPEVPFDVISMADVLEHMPFPKAALAHARELLCEDGLLFLSMPNADSFLWATLTKNAVNPYFAELEHYHNFGRRRLYRLLEECGFTPRRYGLSQRYRACMEVIAQRTPRQHAAVSVAKQSSAESPIATTPSRETTPPAAVVQRDAIRLNVGCGRSPLEGWVNLDSARLPGVDLVVDLELAKLPFDDNSVSEISASHVLEHIHNSLGLMQELHRVARPDAVAIIRVPYGSSDDADEDPTHVRRYFWSSWGYFSQPYYWRADYGYRGDWELEDVQLTIDAKFTGMSWAEVFAAVQRDRNVVKEMVATLRAIKPARQPLRALQKQTLVRFVTG